MTPIKCIFIGHEWVHVKTIRKDKPVPNVRAVYLKNYRNVWKCIHCGTMVNVPMTKQPNNRRRERFERRASFFNGIFE